MPFIEIKSRDLIVKVYAVLSSAPALRLRRGLGWIEPSSITVAYESPLGGDRWRPLVHVVGSVVPPLLGRQEGSVCVEQWSSEELHLAPDWVAGFVDLEAPDAALRGGAA